MPDQEMTKKEDLRIAAKLALFTTFANILDNNLPGLHSNLRLH